MIFVRCGNVCTKDTEKLVHSQQVIFVFFIVELDFKYVSQLLCIQIIAKTKMLNKHDANNIGRARLSQLR